jgi:hypothetical protein
MRSLALAMNELLSKWRMIRGLSVLGKILSRWQEGRSDRTRLKHKQNRPKVVGNLCW